MYLLCFVVASMVTGSVFVWSLCRTSKQADLLTHSRLLNMRELLGKSEPMEFMDPGWD